MIFLDRQESFEELFRYICVKFSGAPRQKKTATCIVMNMSEKETPTISEIKDFYRTRLPGSIIPGNFTVCCEEDAEQKNRAESGDETICSQLELAIYSQNQQSLREKLKALFQLWSQKQAPLSRIRKKIHWIILLCEKAGILKVERIALNDRIDEDMIRLDSYEEMRDSFAHILEENISLDSCSAPQNDKVLFEQITELVLHNLNRNYSLQEISNIFQVSQPYIRKVFLRYTGKTYNDFIADEKIAYAVKLIQSNPEIQVKELAFALGYEQLYFSTIFKKKMGITLSQYRQFIAGQ